MSAAELTALANDDAQLEIARHAVEDRLVTLRDLRISVFRNNGLCIHEPDGEQSPVIRLGTEEALRIGLLAIAQAWVSPS
jgi:hypothetical protein